ncbi:type I toxin-antitoxin system toxin Ldr family protein [Escherichia coli]|nr:type I toxin-antitoxin system toxin Ldr family protein [Escherichia coli]
MTLAELGMAFWHDLAAPVIAGILAEVTCHAGVRLP